MMEHQFRDEDEQFHVPYGVRLTFGISVRLHRKPPLEADSDQHHRLIAIRLHEAIAREIV
jgi:hypothetical protein